MSQFSDAIENGRNKNLVKCKFCCSKILTAGAAPYTSFEFKLPLMKQKTAGIDPETETVSDFWQVDDVYAFENIGVTHKVDKIKYLSCADCEMGPIGYHDIESKKNYVSLARVD